MAKVLVSIDDDLLRRVDGRARELGLSRSAYIARMAAADLRPRPRPRTTVDRVRRARNLVRAELRERRGDAPYVDSTDLVRRMRDER